MIGSDITHKTDKYGACLEEKTNEKNKTFNF